MLSDKTIQSEKSLRNMIERNLAKEFHPGTKPSIDFIKHILDEAYESGMQYDVSDMRSRIIAFANNSTNQPMESLKVVQQMKWYSERPDLSLPDKEAQPADERNVFFDLEVYPNLFVICWKYEGAPTTVRMINPSPQEVEGLLKFKLIGFNNRRYDNHILYARFMGYTNEQLYTLSQKLINNQTSAYFGEAYNLSYTDIYDFSSVKQGLKKFMTDLGINKVEMSIPWDQPVPDDMVDKVVEYCVNDVEGTEKVFKAREQDFVARQILAELSGLSVNDPTAKHTAKIIFGNDRDAKRSFVYTDLSADFPGYTYDMGKSKYKSSWAPEDAEPEEPGEGGYVFARPGMYYNVAILDVASMHPTSIKALNAFGEYTPRFVELLDARVAIKRGNFDEAKKMLGGKLAPYLKDKQQAKDLAYALKIVINIVYGMTAAKFDNPFRIPNNKDNIVAKRGALFMIDLKYAVESQGYDVVHIKTDSIKIPNADEKIIQFVTDFGREYGYEFEHEATYDAFCLVNDAVYIAREDAGGTVEPHWTAVGAQFQHPYVFKTLFTEEPIEFNDMAETKSVVKGAIYLDFTRIEETQERKPTPEDLEKMQFVGKIGSFVPVTKESGIGGVLYRVSEDGKFYAVAGTKGYLWYQAEPAKAMGVDLEIDMNYFEELAEQARTEIDYWGPFEHFANGTFPRG